MVLDSVVGVLNGALDGALTLLGANYLLGERIAQAIKFTAGLVVSILSQVRAAVRHYDILTSLFCCNQSLKSLI